MKRYYWLLTVLMIIQGCSSLKTTYVWRLPEYKDMGKQKILVLGLIRDNDRRLQKNMEDHVAGDLNDLGYTAVTSLEQFGPKAFEGMDEAMALGQIRDSNIDAVITIVLLNKENERKYIPSRINPVYGPPDNFWDYRRGLYNKILEPGYYVTNTNYFWESNFFQLKPQKLVFTMQTRSFDPANSWSMGHEYGHLIASVLLKKNVLQNKNAIGPTDTNKNMGHQALPPAAQ